MKYYNGLGDVWGRVRPWMTLTENFR